MTIEQINAEILQIQGPRGAISDGYHTFDMLYEMRMALTAAFFNALQDGFDVVKSWNHADGEKCFGGGWFIVQAQLPTGQISFHYSEKYWDRFTIKEVELPNPWDGHTAVQVGLRHIRRVCHLSDAKLIRTILMHRKKGSKNLFHSCGSFRVAHN